MTSTVMLISVELTLIYETNCQLNTEYIKVNVKPYRYRPGGFQEVKVPRFRDNGTGWW